MRIAVPYENGCVFQHFGHSERFRIYDADSGKIKSAVTVPVSGGGHEALADFLSGLRTEAVICGGIGAGAVNALTEKKIAVYAGVSGSCDEAVAAFLDGTLCYGTAANCSHHGEGHSCHEHSCGGHCGKSKP